MASTSRLVSRRPFPSGACRRGRVDQGKEVLGDVIAYEILLMLDPELAEERQNEVVTRIRELVERGAGTWHTHDAWGRRRLAYEIKHKPEGVYHLVTFETEPETLDEISRVLRITDGVMRHLAVRRVAGSRTGPPPAEPVAVQAPDYSATPGSQDEEEE